MTEKRYTYDSKSVSLMKDGDFWLDGNVDTACNHKEICSELNGLVDENEQLKKELNEFKQLDIPIDKIEDTVRDGRGRTVGVYYND